MARHRIYHPDYESVIVVDGEYEQLLQQGWYDSPAKFPNKEAVNVDLLTPTMEVKKTEDAVVQVKEKPKKSK